LISFVRNGFGLAARISICDDEKDQKFYDITIGGTSQFTTEVNKVLSYGINKLYVDFCNVEHLDSSGLWELVQADLTVEHKKGNLVFFNVNKKIKKIIKWAKLTTFITVFESEKKAIAKLNEN